MRKYFTMVRVDSFARAKEISSAAGGLALQLTKLGERLAVYASENPKTAELYGKVVGHVSAEIDEETQTASGHKFSWI